MPFGMPLARCTKVAWDALARATLAHPPPIAPVGALVQRRTDAVNGRAAAIASGRMALT